MGARPQVTAKATSRACALFRRRNGGEIKRGPPSEITVQRSAGPLPKTIGWRDKRTSREKFLRVPHVDQAADQITFALHSCGLGEWPRGLRLPGFAQLFAVLEHERFGLVEIGINTRAFD